MTTCSVNEGSEKAKHLISTNVDGLSPITRSKVTKQSNGSYKANDEFIATFKKNSNHDTDEFIRQASLQEEGINNLTLKELLNNRKKYKINGRDKSSVKYQKQVRSEILNNRVFEIMNDAKLSDTIISKDEAILQATEEFKGMHALHSPDQVSGGHAHGITGLGDGRINNSFGSQWKNNADALDKYLDSLSAGLTDDEMNKIVPNIKFNLKGV